MVWSWVLPQKNKNIVDFDVFNIFVLFNLPEYLKCIHSYLNTRHVNISFTLENKKDNRMSFFDILIICEQDKITTSVYHKPTFNRIYTHFGSFLSSTYKIDMIPRLLYRCFWICSA